MTSLKLSDDPQPDRDDPANPGVEDELQDLVGGVKKRRRDESNDEEFDVGCGGKLPADHPDADLLDDLDL